MGGDRAVHVHLRHPGRAAARPGLDHPPLVLPLAPDRPRGAGGLGRPPGHRAGGLASRPDDRAAADREPRDRRDRGDPPMVDVPSRMKARPVDPRGYPIPWFVNIADDGTADFRVIRPNGVLQAHRTATCWLCGDRLGRFKTFAIGPMCAVNRITSEPGSHLDCARYAAQVCPFLSQPKMKRSPRALPADATTEQPGFHLDRNPGAICLWTCTSARTVRADRGGRGVLFQLG